MRLIGSVLLLIVSTSAVARSQQTPDAAPTSTASTPTAASQQDAAPLKQHPLLSAEDEAEELRISKLAIVNGRPYDQPSELDKFLDYANDTYGIPGVLRSTSRALFSQAQDIPSGWGQDWPGFGQREGSALATTAISGTVRYSMELVFHEDLRYLVCHGCSAKKKLANVFLAEITARHEENGHRFFTITPTIADFSGPIIAHTIWYPGSSQGPLAGVVAARTLFAARIGQHLLQEFVFEHFHHDKKYGN